MSTSITFAVPFFSRHGTGLLRRTLESIAAQEDSNWEALVLDDASGAPDVEATVREYGKGRIRFIRNPVNLGIGGNFNRCIDLAETDLVTVVHADDELMPNYCGTMRRAAARYPKAAAIFCRVQIVGPDGRRAFSLPDLAKRVIQPSPQVENVLVGEPGVRAMLRGNFILAPTLCFRKSVLRGRRFPEKSKFTLDWEMTTTLLLDGDSLVSLPQRCYRYRRHAGSSTEEATRTHLRFHEESDFLNRMAAESQRRGWDRCAKLAMKKRLLRLHLLFRAIQSAARLDLGQARRRIGLLRDL